MKRTLTASLMVAMLVQMNSENIALAQNNSGLSAQERSDAELAKAMSFAESQKTPQSFWRDQFFDAPNSYNRRPLTDAKRNALLREAKGKSEDRSLSAHERHEWDRAYSGEMFQ